jgi:hypothetical protein
MQTSITKVSACECGHSVDRATSAFGDHVPKPGDLTICMHCGRVNVFDGELGIKPLPKRDLRKLPSSTRSQITTLQREIKAFRESN